MVMFVQMLNPDLPVVCPGNAVITLCQRVCTLGRWMSRMFRIYGVCPAIRSGTGAECRAVIAVDCICPTRAAARRAKALRSSDVAEMEQVRASVQAMVESFCDTHAGLG